MNPAEAWVAREEAGKEQYCAAYPESGTERIYTVCRVPSIDTNTCPLIAYNSSNCCICQDCGHILGEGVNVSLGLSPSNATVPGVDSCIIKSQRAMTFDCFVQRSSSVVTSLRQHTGTMSFYEPVSE